MEFSKRVATEAFHFVFPVVTSGADHSQSGSVRRTRNEVAGDLRKIKMNIQKGKEDEDFTVGKQIYIGRMNCCRGHVEKLGNSGTVIAEQKANLRAIHMATKSRPMKSLRNFQKRGNMEPHQPLLVNTHQDLN